ncbi:MAG: hypothetical protein AAGK04_10350 [Planctomycetota bacterium]
MHHNAMKAHGIGRLGWMGWLGWATGVGVLLSPLGGCDREGVSEQRVAKGLERVPDAETPARQEPQQPDGNTATDASAAAESRPWTTPAGWTEDTEPRRMRLATYLAPDPSGPIEVAITRFGGRVGGELANVNRWRGQMGLASVDAGGLDAVLERFTSAGFEGYQTRIDSDTGVMLAAGVYEASADQTWFVRTTAPDAATADRVQSDVFGVARSIAGLGE